jgi:hypothetical protein
VWPVWVALPPFSLCSAYRVTGVMLVWGVALGLQCGNVYCAAVVTNNFQGVIQGVAAEDRGRG